MNDIIKSSKNEFVKFAKSLKTKKGRNENDAFLIEGEKCVAELASNMPQIVRGVIIADDKYSGLAESMQKTGASVYHVSEAVLISICDCKTPQGIAAIAAMPEYDEVYSGFMVMLDDVQDPQNVGAIIRTADAAGCSCVVLSEGSADFFSPKAVRASMGSLFHIPVIKANLAAYIEKLASICYQIVIADIKGETKYSFDWDKTCLIIGNESRGVSKEVQKLSTGSVTIPIFGKAESLNAAVAAGILIYKIRT